MKISLIDLAFLSEKRKDLLLLLEEGPKTGDEIKTALNVNSTSIMPQIKKLKEGHLIVQDDNNEYRLSDMGEIVVEKMEPLLDTVRVFEENYDYWINHDFTAIPEHLLNRINELGNYFMLEADLNRLFEVPEDFKKNLLASKHIKMFLSYFNPLHIEIYSELVRKEAEMCLIMTEVVTERFCSLVLFDKKGKFDHQRLISFDESALKWCEELFLYYKDMSRRLEKI